MWVVGLFGGMVCAIVCRVTWVCCLKRVGAVWRGVGESGMVCVWLDSSMGCACDVV